MENSGYGDKFAHMINIPYNNIPSKTKVNDLLSDPLTLMRGVRKGYPLSMLLSVNAIDILPNFIDADKRIKRIQIGGHETKIVNLLTTLPSSKETLHA